MKKYIIQDRESGYLIDTFNSLAEAEKELKKYENEDEANGIYEENFYEIKETK
jgi:hypothetical protein